MHERDDLRPLSDHFLHIRQVETAVVGETDPAQGRPGPLAQHLPGHQVGMVLHLGDDDLVARTETEPLRLGAGGGGIAHRVGDEVQRLGGVLGEDDLVTPGRADEGGDPVASGLVQRGRLLGQHVDAAVDVGVVQLVVVPLGVEDGRGLLRAGRAVEVDQRPAVVDTPGQDREVLADLIDVVPAPRLSGGAPRGRGHRVRHRHTAVPAGAGTSVASVALTYRS